MRFAISNGQRIEATPKARGACGSCDAEMVARCGTRKVWHWAHKTKRSCDHWWEPETEWHRKWKQMFPADWTEVVQKATSGERHIADVRTPEGLVIEFQHSHIDIRESTSRELFYENMIWVVDGTRLKRDQKLLNWFIFLRQYSGWVGPVRFNGMGFQASERWARSDKPVFLDFGGDDLWCISPDKEGRQFLAAQVSKLDFVESFTAGRVPRSIQELLSI